MLLNEPLSCGTGVAATKVPKKRKVKERTMDGCMIAVMEGREAFIKIRMNG